MQTLSNAGLPLLTKEGKLTQPSYSATEAFIFNREDINCNRMRVKEWDFYQISNRDYVVQITYGHASYAGTVSCFIFELKTGKKIEIVVPLLFVFDRLNMPLSQEKSHKIEYKKGKMYLLIDVTAESRHIIVKYEGKKSCDIDVYLDNRGRDCIYIATPFDSKETQFYYNCKKNCMTVSGKINFCGQDYPIDDQTFGLIDWGRGVWPYRNIWVWGNGSHRLEDGSTFGFNIGWGFGNTSAATENMIFLNGISHKLDKVYAEIDTSDYLKVWQFKSNDNRFEMTFTPIFDNHTDMNFVVAHNQCHQVWGLFNGTATLDDGTVLNIKDMTAFCERADNRW